MAGQEQQQTTDNITMRVLLDEMHRTGDAVRSVGDKLDSFKDEMRSTLTNMVEAQGKTNLEYGISIATLKSETETGQKNLQSQIDDIKKGTDTRGTNRLSIAAIWMGGLGAVGAIAQALVAIFHK